MSWEFSTEKGCYQCIIQEITDDYAIFEVWKLNKWTEQFDIPVLRIIIYFGDERDRDALEMTLKIILDLVKQAKSGEQR